MTAERKFIITNSSGGQQVVRCANKREANKLAKTAAKLLGWVIVSVIEAK